MKLYSILAKRKKLSGFIAITSMVTIFSFSTSQAAVPVIDYKAIAETMKVLEKAKAQLAELTKVVSLGKEQVALLTQQMTDITGEAKQLLSIHDTVRKELDSTLHSIETTFHSFLQPIQDSRQLVVETEKKWKDTFIDLRQANPMHLSGASLSMVNNRIDENVTLMNKEALVDVAGIQAKLQQELTHLSKLEELARTTTGERDLAKIQAEISATHGRIQSYNAQLSGVQATTATVKRQAELQKSKNTAVYHYEQARKLSESVVRHRTPVNDLPNGVASRKEAMDKMYAEMRK